MNVLVVDDDRAKLRDIIDFLVNDCRIERGNIVTATTGWACREQIRSVRFDLLVLDILLPLRDEDESDARTALDILEDLHQGRGITRPRHIVGLTAIESLATDVIDAFRNRTWTIVQYDSISNAWKSPLRNLIDYLVREVSQHSLVEYKTDVCILTALDVPEAEQVYRLPCAWEAPSPLDDHTFTRKGKILSGGREFSIIAASAPRMGMVATSLLAAKLIEETRPRFIVMAGICAGVDGKVNIGDVLLADPCWNWQSGKHSIDELGPHFAAAPHQLDIPEFIRSRGTALRSDRTHLASIKHGYNGAKPSHELDLRVGPVASGSAVLADETIVKEIQRQERTLLGVEMEIYGVYAAAAFASYPRPTAFAMKSVCDYGSKGKNDEHQAYAAYTSAQMLYVFLERFLHEIAPLAGT